MRRELDQWRLFREGESVREGLARLLIAVDELRARLNPVKYPNLEISDEGHLWFNVPSSIGNLEVVVFPNGFEDLSGPALALSFPHRPNDTGSRFVDVLAAAQNRLPDLENLVLFAAHASKEESLKAYREGRHTSLHVLLGKEEILDHCSREVFFNYCGLYLPVGQVDVTTAGTWIKEVVSYINKECAEKED